MALTKIRLGTNEDGTPHYLYQQDDPSVPLVYTGPISGTVDVTHPDGTTFTYDVTDQVIEVFPGHETYVSDAIGERHVSEGHPSFANEDFDFEHTPTNAPARKTSKKES